MRNIIRHLFLAIVVMALAAFGSGAALAVTIDTTADPSVVSITPSNGRLVGIYPPVTIQFAAAVPDRARMEQRIEIRSAEPLAGTFRWTNSRETVWQPTGFLPANSTIMVNAPGMRTEFRTNEGVVGDADLSNFSFTVSIGGQVVRQMPASMGKPGYETPTGTFPVLEKYRTMVFDSATIGIPRGSSQGYYFTGEYAERLTWGGVFVHSAPWSVDSQGNSNVSHGCINLAPDDAAWYYETVGYGDPVTAHW